MALSPYDSPPLLESKEDIREYLLKLHQDVYGLGNDISGSLSFTDNLIDPPDITGTTNESFTIDTDFTGGDISLIFGNQGSLIYDESESRFNLSDCIKINDDMFICTGSITSDSGAISFSDENLSTTGTLASGVATIDITLIISTGSITDTTGNIDFDDENLSTTGTLTSGAHTLTGNIIMSNNDITGVGDITFTDCSVGTIGGIICENLLDKTATESISGLYTWTANGIVLEDGVPLQIGTGGNDIGTFTLNTGSPNVLDLVLGSDADFAISTSTMTDLLVVDESADTLNVATTVNITRSPTAVVTDRAFRVISTATATFDPIVLIGAAITASGSSGTSNLIQMLGFQMIGQHEMDTNLSIFTGGDFLLQYRSDTVNTITTATGINVKHEKSSNAGAVTTVTNGIGISLSLKTEASDGGLTFDDFKHIFITQSDDIGNDLTVTDFYGINIACLADSNTDATNCYGLYIEEQTEGATINNEIFIGGSGEIFFRDQDIHVGSDVDGQYNMTADNRVKANGRDILSMALMGAT